MINPFKEVDWHPDRQGLLRFAKSLLIGFPAVGIGLALVGRVLSGTWNLQLAGWVAGIGVVAGLLFLVIPVIARPVYVVWYGIACSIGLVVSNALMVMVFYGVFTPLGLAMRLSGRRPLQLSKDPHATSYWAPAPPSTDNARYYRQF